MTKGVLTEFVIVKCVQHAMSEWSVYYTCVDVFFFLMTIKIVKNK